MTITDSKIAKIQTDFKALSKIASELNTASDHLTKTVALLDEALKRLNVGLTVWVIFRSLGDDDQPNLYDLDQIGYCKVNGTWGLALRHIWGDEFQDWQKEDGPWLFNDASRELRLLSVDKIPEVIAELTKEALKTTERVQKKTEEVLELAEAILQVGTDAKRKPLTPAEQGLAGQAFMGKLSDMLVPQAKEGKK
jgi:uncharacterized small protein (DUF1192 family)